MEEVVQRVALFEACAGSGTRPGEAAAWPTAGPDDAYG